ncbi:MAG: hypothetical protein Q8J69_05595 [Sphingobacteriaceae bacterium]|nr:hypothetical protein [Sphingobacteriaceae bacterium]
MKFLSLFCCCVLLLSCKKESAQAPIPEITILQAPSSLSIQVPDTVRLTLDLRGEEELVSLKVNLLNQALVPVTESQVYGISGKSQRLEIVYPINDPQLDDGAYFLALSLNTARESGNKFVPVQLTGIPRTATGAVFLASVGNQTRIYQTDSSGLQPQLRASLPFALKDAVYDPSSACVWLTGMGNSSLYRYRLADFQTSPVFSSLPAPGFETYRSMHLGPQWLYLGRGQGNVVAIDAAATQKWLYNLPEGYVPGMIQHLQQYFLVEMQPIDPTAVRRMQLIEPDRQGLIRELAMNGPLLGAARLANNEVLLLVEEAGQGKLYRYTPSNSRFESETGPDTRNFRSILTLPSGDLIIRSNSSLWRYQPGSNVRTGQFSQLANENFESVSHDPLLNRLLAIQQNQASYISLPSGSNQSIFLPEAMKIGFLTRSRK